ncbi:aminotransferase class I/II-fold pyridoxal phosphate-dependent enzyme [Streptomyces sp. SL13]|uniref:Aminotransferase class I/II-fold pyridoxal phosphate-dependent enzyme n=1 Tax=Streptantibioticus silvisoli TaxID=2705255 RepID=A0AA90H5A7_9ACTN|nr:aminotransferase class I/II-fold pyridoxal phosphate-dependent enzyme [Streptantibioticus silvisoli]MDI5967258.1 aminotransferase class I/II-fold pyridoxal phosphate-dependent enzyme [Streptantibioticus silvisoli]MDI5971228.1 aminotransferase class I/II-fold pyridoxal phosphate-dependent enzyme [Streptantibioticus silvisoli]
MSHTDGWNRMQPAVSAGLPLHQMALNETYHPPLPGVLRAVADTASQAHLTLDAMGQGLERTIAEQVDVPVADVLVGPGSAGLLQQMIATHTGPGARLVHAWPSWEAYPMMAANAGCATVRVPLLDGVHDLDALADAAADGGGLLLVCNPNTPTGTAVGEQALRRMLDRLPAGVTVLIDEAYRAFSDDKTVAAGIDLYRDDERVCVVRTFSKSHGLLSLRVGYVVGHPRVLAPMRALQMFFRVSAVAQAAAVAALAEDAEIRRRCAETVVARERLRDVLLGQGWDVTPSQANFLWLPLTEGVERFTQFCADNGVLVCGKPGEGIRVTVSSPEANDAFAALAAAFRQGTADH